MIFPVKNAFMIFPVKNAFMIFPALVVQSVIVIMYTYYVTIVTTVSCWQAVFWCLPSSLCYAGWLTSSTGRCTAKSPHTALA